MRPDVPPHGAQAAPWGPRRSGATTAERGPHRACCARWGAISGIFEGGATQSAGMHRRPNAGGVSPRAAMPRHSRNTGPRRLSFGLCRVASSVTGPLLNPNVFPRLRVMLMHNREPMKKLLLGTVLCAIPVVVSAQERPFGTLREQAAMQQQWLTKRLDTFLPALMRTHGIDMWIVPMREYNEDPVFSSIVEAETFAAS